VVPVADSSFFYDDGIAFGDDSCCDTASVCSHNTQKYYEDPCDTNPHDLDTRATAKVYVDGNNGAVVADVTAPFPNKKV
jgi:hypothetical protein